MITIVTSDGTTICYDGPSVVIDDLLGTLDGNTYGNNIHIGNDSDIDSSLITGVDIINDFLYDTDTSLKRNSNSFGGIISVDDVPSSDFGNTATSNAYALDNIDVVIDGGSISDNNNFSIIMIVISYLIVLLALLLLLLTLISFTLTMIHLMSSTTTSFWLRTMRIAM